MMCKIVYPQKLMLQDIMRSTKIKIFFGVIYTLIIIL